MNDAVPRFTPPPHAPRPGQPPVRAELPDGSTAWLVSGYEQVRQVSTDPRFSRAAAVAPGRSRPGFEAYVGGSIIGTDPPEHTRLLRVVASALTPRRVEAMRPRVASIVDGLIDALLGEGPPADLVASFALPLPVQVICEMLGIHTYIGELTEIRRARPADDLISDLVAAAAADSQLSEWQLVSLGTALLVGGYESTATQLGLSVLVLLDQPTEFARLRLDLALIPAAVEELLRYIRFNANVPPILPRVTTQDVQLGGVTIPAGEVVAPLYAAANRDPSVFTDPGRFDIGRASANHLAFGSGVHRCVGAQLARLELREALRGLIARLPGLALAVPASQLRFDSGKGIHSLAQLPVTWDEPG